MLWERCLNASVCGIGGGGYRVWRPRSIKPGRVSPASWGRFLTRCFGSRPLLAMVSGARFAARADCHCQDCGVPMLKHLTLFITETLTPNVSSCVKESSCWTLCSSVVNGWSSWLSSRLDCFIFAAVSLLNCLDFKSMRAGERSCQSCVRDGLPSRGCRPRCSCVDHELHRFFLGSHISCFNFVVVAQLNFETPNVCCLVPGEWSGDRCGYEHNIFPLFISLLVFEFSLSFYTLHSQPQRFHLPVGVRFLVFLPPCLRHLDRDPALPPHPLLFVPTGLILRVPGATWVKHAELGHFFLSHANRTWRIYLASPPLAQVELDQDQKAFLRMHRTQLPCKNLFSLTAYNLQGQTLPSLILDLANPPYMKAVLRSLQLIFPKQFHSSCSFFLVPIFHPTWLHIQGWLLDCLPGAVEPRLFTRWFSHYPHAGSYSFVQVTSSTVFAFCLQQLSTLRTANLCTPVQCDRESFNLQCSRCMRNCLCEI